MRFVNKSHHRANHIAKITSDCKMDLIKVINNGNRTEWSPTRSQIMRVINEIVNHEYDYRLNWTTRCPVTS